MSYVLCRVAYNACSLIHRLAITCTVIAQVRAAVDISEEMATINA